MGASMQKDNRVIIICIEALRKLDEAENYTRAGIDCISLDSARSSLIDIILQGVKLTQQDILRLLWNTTKRSAYRGPIEGEDIIEDKYKLLVINDCFIAKDEEGYQLYSQESLRDAEIN